MILDVDAILNFGVIPLISEIIDYVHFPGNINMRKHIFRWLGNEASIIYMWSLTLPSASKSLWLCGHVHVFLLLLLLLLVLVLNNRTQHTNLYRVVYTCVTFKLRPKHFINVKIRDKNNDIQLKRISVELNICVRLRHKVSS